MDKLTYAVSDNITVIETKASTPAPAVSPQEGGGVGPRQGGGGGASQIKIATGKETTLRIKGRDKQTVRYLVAMKGNSGWIEFTINSLNGGTDKKKIEIKVN